VHESTIGTPVGSASATTTPVASINPKALHPGTQNYIAKFDNTGTATLNSVMYQDPASGYLGVNTTVPGISLDVRTGALPQMGIAGTTDYLTFFASDVFGPAIYWDPAKDMRFGKGGTGLYNPFGFVEYMRIQSSTGNVGIGTSSPVYGATLDVAGNINMSGLLTQGVPFLQMPGGVFDYNIALGYGALVSNTSGIGNTAIGGSTLPSKTTGNHNTAIGYQAGFYVADGKNYNIHIGSLGSSADNGTIRIGESGAQTKFFVAGVRGITTGSNDAIPVMIDSNGQLGTKSSSRRFKEDIADMGVASHDLMRLRPVTYRYKEPFADGTKPIQYGLIAEEVAEVYPDLVAHSADGQIETVKYQVLDSMLLNEVQRQQTEIRRLEQQVNEQHQQISEQQQQNQRLQERLVKLEAALASMSEVGRISGVQR
jgi:hypothetical protein